MADTLKIKIILGSTRQNRFGEKAAQWIYEIAKQQPGFDVELLDLRDYPIPYYDDPVSPTSHKGPYTNPVVAKWAEKIKEADGFIVCTPEYNHGTSAILKSAFDCIYHEWNQKAVGFVSWGSVGGGRVIEQLRLLSVEMQMAPIRNAVYIMNPWTLNDESGNLKGGALEPYERSAKGFLEQLTWWTTTLKTARETTK